MIVGVEDNGHIMGLVNDLKTLQGSYDKFSQLITKNYIAGMLEPLRMSQMAALLSQLPSGAAQRGLTKTCLRVMLKVQQLALLSMCLSQQVKRPKVMKKLIL